MCVVALSPAVLSGTQSLFLFTAEAPGTAADHMRLRLRRDTTVVVGGSGVPIEARIDRSHNSTVVFANSYGSGRFNLAVDPLTTQFLAVAEDTGTQHWHIQHTHLVVQQVRLFFLCPSLDGWTVFTYSECPHGIEAPLHAHSTSNDVLPD